jgi:hypothetical protein
MMVRSDGSSANETSTNWATSTPLSPSLSTHIKLVKQFAHSPLSLLYFSPPHSAGNRVGLDAMNCPSLMYVAPKRSKSVRSVRGARLGGKLAK